MIKKLLKSVSLLFSNFALYSFMVILFPHTVVQAHPLDVIYFQLQATGDGRFNSCLNIHPENLKTITKIADATQENLQAFQFFAMSSDDHPCQIEFKSANFRPTDTELCYDLKCAVSSRQSYSLSFDLLDKLDPSNSVIGQFKNGNLDNAFVLNQKNKVYALATAKMDFLHLGIEHIGAHPGAWKNELNTFQIADGIDHILFIVLLVLVSTSWRSLLVNVSGFTVGHSITLGLALAGIVVIPAVYIEPAIAASIAFLAYKVFRFKSFNKGLALTVFFGFLHGIGFSYILDGLKFENIWNFLKVLLLFNVGIELGQLIIIVILLPLFLLITHKAAPATGLKRGVGFIIFCLSAFWCVERLLHLFHTL